MESDDKHPGLSRPDPLDRCWLHPSEVVTQRNYTGGWIVLAAIGTVIVFSGAFLFLKTHGVSSSPQENAVPATIAAVSTSLASSAAWLGVRCAQSMEPIGVEVQEVMAGSPAANMGLEPGDVVEELESDSMSDIDKFMSAVAAHHPGDVVSLTVWRQGEVKHVNVQLAAKGSG